jgi:hypothetical protein
MQTIVKSKARERHWFMEMVEYSLHRLLWYWHAFEELSITRWFSIQVSFPTFVRNTIR